MNVHTMQQRPGVPSLPIALPIMPLVRSQGDTAAWSNANHAIGVHSAQARNACRMDGLGSQRGRFAQFSQGKNATSCADWPGRGFGIRAPIDGETCLSQEEVNFELDRVLMGSVRNGVDHAHD